jgi:NTE family protein
VTAPPKRAIVLSGGGARGAYAAGVVRYIVQDVSEALGRPAHFDIISGTSAGAINATWLAATMDDPEYCGQRLWYQWRSMRLKETVNVSYQNIWTMVRRLLADTSENSLEPRPGRSYSMLDTSYFTKLISQEIPYANIASNIHNGILDALTITATDVHTGRTMVFVQAERSELPPWTRDPRRIASSGPITADKVLASAAIPILFPAVKIGERWYFDGGLRQNTPISPALRMGAKRLMVISLLSAPTPPRFEPRPEQIETPTVSFLIGKLLNALLLDPLDYDLSFMERINAILRHGEEAVDEEFVDKLNDVIEAYRGQAYRIVEPLLFRPSVDLGGIAADLAGQLTDKDWGNPVLATIGRRAAEGDGVRESDFLSYLLFDSGYSGRLLDLGYADAKAKHAKLVEFFTD